MARVRLLLVVLLVPLAAGCFKGEDAPEEAETPAPEPEPTAELPRGRGLSGGNVETNRTEPGLAGKRHEHDPWEGRDQVVLVERDAYFALLPLLPEGPGTTPRGVSYVRPAPGMHVWEGTVRLTVLVRPYAWADVEATAPPLTLQHRGAADAAWRDPVPVADGVPIEIPVQPHETDMPHARASLWHFRFLTDRPALLDGFNVTITAHRGHDADPWPGHPDFYAETKERVVFRGEVTDRQEALAAHLYEAARGWTYPEKLISHGTGALHVHVNVTRFTSTPPLPLSGFGLYVHNATETGVRWSDGTYYRASDSHDRKDFFFEVPVDENGMDSPYQPSSRWGFRVVPSMDVFETTTYELTYQLTIVALKAEPVIR